MALLPPKTPPPSLSLSAVSLLYHSDGSVSLQHMDPHYYDMAVSNSQSYFHPHAFSSPLKFPLHLIHIFEHYLHHPTKPANPSTVNGETSQSPEISHEYYNIPAADIRTTDSDFYFDVELPGVTEKGDISIHWTSSWNFIVEGEIPRPQMPSPAQFNGNTHSHTEVEPANNPLVRCPCSEEGDVEVKQSNGDETHDSTSETMNGSWPPSSVAENGSSSEALIGQKHGKQEYQLVLGERKIGRYRRSFKIPDDIDLDVKGTEATLEAGVLTIRVPRMEPFENPEWSLSRRSRC